MIEEVNTEMIEEILADYGEVYTLEGQEHQENMGINIPELYLKFGILVSDKSVALLATALQFEQRDTWIDLMNILSDAGCTVEYLDLLLHYIKKFKTGEPFKLCSSCNEITPIYKSYCSCDYFKDEE